MKGTQVEYLLRMAPQVKTQKCKCEICSEVGTSSTTSIRIHQNANLLHNKVLQGIYGVSPNYAYLKQTNKQTNRRTMD